MDLSPFHPFHPLKSAWNLKRAQAEAAFCCPLLFKASFTPLHLEVCETSFAHVCGVILITLLLHYYYKWQWLLISVACHVDLLGYNGTKQRACMSMCVNLLYEAATDYSHVYNSRSIQVKYRMHINNVLEMLRTIDKHREMCSWNPLCLDTAYPLNTTLFVSTSEFTLPLPPWVISLSNVIQIQ